MEYADDNVGWLMVFVLGGCFLVWLLIRWIRGGASSPNPWDAQIDQKLASGDAYPICSSCLEALPEDLPFCPQCGHAVGNDNNVSPYLYIFSLGECLRTGVHRPVKISFVTVFGYLFLSLIQYQIFAPIYWYYFAKQQWKSPQPPAAEPPLPAAGPAT